MKILYKNKLLFGWLCLLVFALLIFNGCATDRGYARIADLWTSVPYSGGCLDRMIVIGKPEKEADRFTYEDSITHALNKQKVIVIPGYTIIPEINDVNSENVRQAAVETGVKAILVVKVVSVDEKDVIFKKEMFSDPKATKNSLMMLGTYLKDVNIKKQKNARIEAALFDASSERLLWAVTSAAMNPDSADSAVKDFSKAMVHQLVTDGFLR